jgi:hypothetical protein
MLRLPWHPLIKSGKNISLSQKALLCTISQRYLMYSQQAWDTATRQLRRVIKLIERIRYLQAWPKSSVIWRWLSGLKWELFAAFSRVELLMFFDERALSISLLIYFFAAYFTSLLNFLALARWRTSKSELLQKALISDLIINVK